MRVLVLNYEYPPLGGGAGNATFHLLGEFCKRDDLEVDLVTSSVDGTRVERLPEVDGTRVERLPDSVTIHFLDIGKSENIHYQSNAELITYSARAVLYARGLMRRKRYDVVHAFFGIPCGVIAMGLGKPYVVSLRGSDVPGYSDRYAFLDKHFFSRLSKKVWKGAGAVVANSEGLQELALETAPNQPIGIIRNGVDTDFFRPAPVKVVRDTVRVVSTGRLIKRKGYDHLIQALSGVDGYALTLVGDGNQKEELEALSAELGVDVTFAGRKTREEVRDILRESDLFVLPSLNEGMSNSLLEAMATGLPIIVTDAPGSDELVDGNGILAGRGDIDHIRDGFEIYNEKPELLSSHGARSRKIVEKMSWDSVAEEYLEIYKRVIRSV